MATSATITYDGLDELRRELAALPARLFADAKAAVSAATFSAHKAISANLNGGALHVRSGTLARSMKPSVVGTTFDTLKGSVSSDVVYAPLHEYGGVVRAKNKYAGVPGGPYLNIPTDANKTPAGVMRMGAREVFNAGGYLAKSKRGNWGVFLDGRLMFSLTKQVTIKARLGMRKAAEDEVEPLLTMLAMLLQDSLERPA